MSDDPNLRVIKDNLREMEKAWDVLSQVDTYFHHQTEMNAKLHLAISPRPSPLAAAVATEVVGLGVAINALRKIAAGQVPLPLDE
jgi:hypothetical protein